MNGPEYPFNHFVKHSRRRLWGITNPVDGESVKNLTRAMLKAPKFRMPYNLAKTIKGKDPYHGVRLPYPEMVLEFQHDPEDREAVEPRAGFVTGTVEFVFLAELYEGPDGETFVTRGDDVNKKNPIGIYVLVPLWFGKTHEWGVFPWAGIVLYPDTADQVIDTVGMRDFYGASGPSELDKTLPISYEPALPESCQAFMQHWKKEELTPEQEGELIMTQIRDPVFESMAFAALMACRNVRTVDVPPSRSARKRARDRAQLPPYTYHTLDIFLDEVRHQGPAQGGHHEAPRLHKVRGHFKNRATGRYWWRPFVRGNPEHGRVDKDYQLKPKREGKTDD